MCYFEPAKRTSSGADFIKSQQSRFAQLVAEAKVIAIVGIRVRPWDSHIWTPLQQAKGRIVYCSGKRAGVEFRDWMIDAGRSDDLVLQGYFADCFRQILAEVGLG